MKTKFTPIAVVLLKMLNASYLMFGILLIANYSFGQAPVISYASPQTYSIGVSITPLIPSNTGGAVGSSSSTVLASSFASPNDIAVDSIGNVYVADGSNNVVKKIPAGGGAPVIIGTGFNFPEGVTIDAAGNVYVADTYNDLVKEIPADGSAMITFATAFKTPFAITLDNSGNMYVSDANGLRKIPLAGGTPVTIVPPQSFDAIRAVALDKFGNIFYVDNHSNQLREKLANGGSTVVILTEPVGNLIDGIALDTAGNIYYTGYQSGYVTKVTPGGQRTIVGSGFTNPWGIGLDAEGRIYVSDITANTVTRITTGGYTINPALPPGLSFNTNTGVISGAPTQASPAINYIINAYNSSGSGSATINLSVTAIAKPVISYNSPNFYQQNGHESPLIPVNTGGAVTPVKTDVLISNLNAPGDVAVDAAGNIYYIEIGLKVVKMIPAGGGNPVIVAAGFREPDFLAVDGSGNIFVTEGGSSPYSIKKIPAGGGSPVVFATGTTFYGGLSADGAGNIYALDVQSLPNKVLKFSPSGGTPVTFASLARNASPIGIAADHAGNIYIADIGSGKLTEINATTHALTDLATTGTPLSGAAVDASGNVLFNERDKHNLSMYVAATGKVITIGKGLNEPVTLAVDISGNAYVVDAGLGLIRKFSSSGYYADEPLPAGLTISKATGIISGTPTVTSPATTYNVTAINSGGSSSTSFSLKVLANSLLSNLVPSVSNLGPPFKSEALDYNMTVASSVSSITFTPTVADAAATITVNGATVASGTASAAIPLTTGDNAVHVVVTATDGSKSTYSVLVTRVPSGNYYLATLLTSNGILSPTFTHLTNSYTTQVGAYVASMTVTPTVVDSTATITVNGTPLASGATSAAIPLIVGVNPINIAVTAQNGTVNTYTINVTRVPSTNAYLMRILLNHGYDVPLFSHLIFNYATPVPNGVSAIKVTPIGAVSSSTILVNGTVVVSGTASDDIPLAVGVNNISILVTAQDGVTQNTYTVTVTREPPSLNTVYQPVGVATTNGLDGLAGNDVLVHSGLSPNGDGINDFLLIDGIANYPENKLQIMTRNGQLIFEAKNYDNSTKVFDGHSNKTGQRQLPGTYFYQLDYSVKGEIRHKTGFIVLKY